MKASDITTVTKRVTRKWARQIKREERDSRAAFNRRQYLYSDRICQSDVAWPAIKAAYLKASDNGRLPAHARQIYYAARESIREATDREVDSKYFTQNLLPRCMNEHASETTRWLVAYDPRGSFIEPHTGHSVPMGTLDVERYLKEIATHKTQELSSDPVSLVFPTRGPTNRISAVLFIEKEGFHPLFKAVKLAERYDLAIMSSKGQSTVATRRLVDSLCNQSGGVPLLVLHDFDKWGLSIAENLTVVSWQAEAANRVRYSFKNKINVIDLGLRLADVEEWKLDSERVTFKGSVPRSATREEREFLRSGRRVELNAFMSADFITCIERKLQEHGIKKIVPDAAALETAYRRSFQAALMNIEIEEITASAEAQAEDAELPEGLAERIRKALSDNPAVPWDAVVADIARAVAEGHENKVNWVRGEQEDFTKRTRERQKGDGYQ